MQIVFVCCIMPGWPGGQLARSLARPGFCYRTQLQGLPVPWWAAVSILVSHGSSTISSRARLCHLTHTTSAYTPAQVWACGMYRTFHHLPDQCQKQPPPHTRGGMSCLNEQQKMTSPPFPTPPQIPFSALLPPTFSCLSHTHSSIITMSLPITA